MSELSNKQLAKYFKLAGQLTELHGGNDFKVKAWQGSAFKIERFPVSLSSLPKEELEKAEGISANAVKRLASLIETGTFPELDELLSITPPGIVEMLMIKGVGPKKVAVLWKELSIETVGELLYACHENRLVTLKGFGAKTQEQIRHAIEYKKAGEGKHHYATVEAVALQLMKDLNSESFIRHISFTGEFRRKLEVISSLDFLVTVNDTNSLKEFLETHPLLDQNSVSLVDDGINATIGGSIKIQFIAEEEKSFYHSLFISSSSKEHLQKTGADKLKKKQFSSEQEIYEELNLPYFEPELREGLLEEKIIKSGKAPELVKLSDLRGCIHNHTTYSDGANTLEEMARYAKECGYEYLAICDHSKSAFYANGLKEERIADQFAEIDKLNKEFGHFKILKGIESDILNDGSLDYADSLLKEFDLIVASVHSNLRMDESKATARLIKAIENPYTTILGHATGRLLLARPGYPIDYKKVIDACAANNVVIELNANPYRLDMDWRELIYALEKGVMISINPDAHRKEGYHDMHFGVCVARKAGLTKGQTFNAKSLEEITAYLKK